jgi:hypothetical protein
LPKNATPGCGSVQGRRVPIETPPVVRALLSRQEVWLVADAAGTEMVEHWVRQGRLAPTWVGETRLFDRRDVDSLLRYRFEGVALERQRRVLVRLCLGELEASRGRLIETGLNVATASYLDEDLLALVAAAGRWKSHEFDEWACSRGLPSADAVMQRLAIFSWARVCLRAGLAK